MSTSLYLMPYTKGDWQIEPNAFIKALKQFWPGVKIHFITNPEEGYLLEWTYRWPSSSEMDGLLDRDLQRIVFSGGGAGIARCATFGLWLQKLYPEAKHLLLFDQQLSFDIIIDGRTVDEIVQLAQSHYSYTDLLEEEENEKQSP